MSLHLSVVPLSLYLPLMLRQAIVMFALVFFVLWFFCLALYLVIGFRTRFLASVALGLWFSIFVCLSPFSLPLSSAAEPIAEVRSPLGAERLEPLPCRT